MLGSQGDMLVETEDKTVVTNINVVQAVQELKKVRITTLAPNETRFPNRKRLRLKNWRHVVAVV